MQENLFAFIDSVMQQAVPPSVDARAEAAAAASAAGPSAALQSPKIAQEAGPIVKTESPVKAER